MLPITVVSSGTSSMKHFLSPSAIWKYKADAASNTRNETRIEESFNNSIFRYFTAIGEIKQSSPIQITFHTSSTLCQRK